MHIRVITVLWLSLCLPTSVWAQGSWPIDSLLRTNDARVQLKQGGTVVATLNTSQLLAIRGVFTGITEAAELSPRLIIAEGNSPNAFAGNIGGQRTVGINLGMIKLIGYDTSQWAAVLGHEVAHLKLDHGTSRMMVNVPLELMEAYLRSSTNSYHGALLSQLGKQLLSTKFSRDQERQSDYLGAIWAVEAGFEVEGAARLHTNLLKRYCSKSSLPFLQSHPTSQERIKELTDLAERLQPSSS